MSWFVMFDNVNYKVGELVNVRLASVLLPSSSISVSFGISR